MKLAVISDIHRNLPACKKVLEIISNLKEFDKLSNPYFKRNSSELIIKKLNFILKNKNILKKKSSQS